MLGEPLNKLLIIAVLTSASASTQTTILPTARTTLSMAHWKAVTSLLARVHKRYLTPTVSTLGFGLLAIVITIALLLLSESVLADSLTAIGFPICFYYGFTGIACAWYYRHDLTESTRNLLLLGVGPVLGGLMLFGVGIKAAFYYGHTENVESNPILGITLPLWMGIGGMILGAIIMIVSRPYFREFFSRKTETAPPGLLDQPPPTGPVPGRRRLLSPAGVPPGDRCATARRAAPSVRAVSRARPTARGTASAETPRGRARRRPSTRPRRAARARPRG